MKIIFDYNRTLFNPDTDALYQGVVELLQYTSTIAELFLVSKNEPGRTDKLEALGIKNFFKEIAFVDNKTLDMFKAMADNDPNVIVIGDRVRGEIRVGNSLGFTTIWVKQGKFGEEASSAPIEEPTYTVLDIRETQNIISSYEK